MVETSGWLVAEANLVPYLLRSVYHSLGMLQNKELKNMEWNLGASYVFSSLGLDKEHIQYPTWSLPLPISCYILTVMLDGALSNKQIAVTSESGVASGYLDAQHFAGNLIWSLCSMTEHMLPQSLEQRFCTISFLLPIIFKAFASYHSFEVLIRGKRFAFSR